jgi:hypothetical protein
MTPGRTSDIKRAIKHVVVFALLGVVMSYAVAWSLAITTCPFAVTPPSNLNATEEIIGPFIEPSGSLVKMEWSGATVLANFSHETFEGEFNAVIPRWVTPLDRRKQYVVAQGWPARSFHWSANLKEKPAGHVLVKGRSFIHTLGYQPYWPGLLINTAFFGSILALLWFSRRWPGMVRRTIRRRRGLCVRCAYDLRGSSVGGTCPECGKVPT